MIRACTEMKPAVVSELRGAVTPCLVVCSACPDGCPQLLTHSQAEGEPQHSWHQLGSSPGGSTHIGQQGNAAAASQPRSVSYASKSCECLKHISCSVGANQLFCGTSMQCIITYILRWCFSYAYCFVFSFRLFFLLLFFNVFLFSDKCVFLPLPSLHCSFLSS